MTMSKDSELYAAWAFSQEAHRQPSNVGWKRYTVPFSGGTMLADNINDIVRIAADWAGDDDGECMAIYDDGILVAGFCN